MSRELPLIPVLVGPTASGKTAVGIELALRLGGEVINADSRQVYRGLEIGTARPTAQECERVPHHCLDLVAPWEVMDAIAYREAALRAVGEVASRGRLPVIVGGSGLYIRALVEGFFEGPGRDEALREELRTQAGEGGLLTLYAQLQQVDPAYAAQIHANDEVRVIRALEVWRLTGRPLTQWHEQGRATAEPLPVAYFGLHWTERAALYERINRRAEAMFREGILAEVQAALAAGVPESAHAFDGHGYWEAMRVLRGEMTLEQAVAATAQRSRNYAKRQYVWFKRLPGIRWIEVDASRSAEQLAEEITLHYRAAVNSL